MLFKNYKKKLKKYNKEAVETGQLQTYNEIYFKTGVKLILKQK